MTRSGLENGPLLFMQPPRLYFCSTFDRVNTAEKADLLLYTVYAHLSQRKCSQAPTGALPFSIPPIKCGFGNDQHIVCMININHSYEFPSIHSYDQC